MANPQILIKNVDPETLKAFKLACLQNDTNMRAEIIRFMEQYPKEPKRQAAI